MSLKKPAVILDDGGTLHVFRRRVNGGLRYSKGLTKFVATGEREWSSFNINPENSFLSSAPTAVYAQWISTEKRLLVFWRDSEGRLQHSVSTPTNEWSTGVVSAMAVPSAPVAALSRDGAPHVFWKGSDSNLWVTWHSEGVWIDHRHFSSERLLGAPTTQHSLSLNVEVFWASPEGEVKRGYYESGWRMELISRAEPCIDADALPQGLLNDSTGRRVYWRGLDCLLYQARLVDGRWDRKRVVHGEMASDPAPLYWADSDRIDVFWKRSDGILMDSVCTEASASHAGKWRAKPYALTNRDDDAPVISEPVALMDTVKKDGGSHVLPRVLWVSVDDDLYETYLVGRQWVTRMVDE